jgi:hypothetical protein
VVEVENAQQPPTTYTIPWDSLSEPAYLGRRDYGVVGCTPGERPKRDIPWTTMAEQQAKPFSPDKTLLGLRTTPAGSIVITNMSDEWALLVTPVLLRSRGCVGTFAVHYASVQIHLSDGHGRVYANFGARKYRYVKRAG